MRAQNEAAFRRRGIHGRGKLQLQGGPAVRDHDRRLGHRRHAGRGDHRGAADPPGPHVRRPVALVRAAAAAAHQRGHFRVRRLGALRDLVLRRPAHLPGAAVRRRSGGVHLLGLAAGDRGGRDHAAARHHDVEGVRRARMADRHPDHARLGRVRGGVLRHHRQAQDAAHLRRELVLRRVHPDGRAAARRQQRRDAGDALEVVLGVRRRAGRDGAVVVRPQRGRASS